HCLNQSALEADRVDHRAPEKRLHYRRRAGDVPERCIPLRGSQRLLLVHRVLRCIGNSLGARRRARGSANTYADAAEGCATSAESKVRRRCGYDEVHEARRQIKSKRRDIASSPSLEKLVRQEARTL